MARHLHPSQIPLNVGVGCFKVALSPGYMGNTVVHSAPSEGLPETLAASLPGVEKVHRRLSTGAMSYLFECSVRGFGERLAVKVWAQGETKLERREVDALKALRHPSLVQLVHVFEGEDSPSAYILEFCAGGSLHQLLHSHENKDMERGLSLRPRARAALDIASGVDHLHGNGFIHRDLQSQYCLLSAVAIPGCDLPPVKITEFGCARHVKQEMTNLTIQDSLCLYTAPEMLDVEAVYGPEVDVYSCAVIFHEIFSGLEPFNDCPKRENPVAMTLSIVRGMRPRLELLPDGIRGTDMLQLIEESWSTDACTRPTAAMMVDRIARLLPLL